MAKDDSRAEVHATGACHYPDRVISLLVLENAVCYLIVSVWLLNLTFAETVRYYFNVC